MFIMEETKDKNKADIRIIGVGGGGSNAIETMIKEGIEGVKFVAVNTDNQALENSSAEVKIQLGSKLTKGLGAGANPEVGRRAAVESYEEIIKSLQGADMVFVTAGMGGGTGTGGAPLVAQAADELDILTVGIVTKPFNFEGQKRMKQAEKGIRELRSYVDTLIVIPNEKLLQISEKNTPLLEAFQIADNVLLQAVKGIAELVSIPGLINLDFADIKTVMLNKGMAFMGRGVAEGADRARKAVCSAMSSPLLEGVSIQGATGMIVNITADSSLSLVEVQDASSVLTKISDNEADVVVGTVIDENMGNKLSVTVIATGFKGGDMKKSEGDLSSLKQDIMSHSSYEEEPFTLKTETPFLTKKTDDNPLPEQEEESSSIAPDQSAAHHEQEDEECQEEESLKQESVEDSPEDNKTPSTKEILLSKAREHAEIQQKKTQTNNRENQMSMDWQENQLEKSLSSPFDSSLDFSEEDML